MNWTLLTGENRERTVEKCAVQPNLPLTQEWDKETHNLQLRALQP